MNTALNNLTANISEASIAQAQIDMTTCLNNLQTETEDTVSQLLDIGVDRFKSDFSLDPSIQFTTRSIIVSVILNDTTGNNLATNLPSNLAAEMAIKIVPTITFGEISNFNYDGYGVFNANLTSKIPGNGVLQIAYNNNLISTLNIPTDPTQSQSITIKELTYTFVNAPSIAGMEDGSPRHDISDIARDQGVS